MRRTGRGLAAILLVVALAAAGCSDDDGASDRASGGGSSGESSGEAGDAGSAGALVTGDEQAGAPAGTPADDREIIYTAETTVRVDDVEEASTKATAIAEDAEGYLAGQDADLEGDRSSTLTIRVPSARFRPTLDALVDLGRVQVRTIDSTDVTDEVVDLNGRLETVRTSADRLRVLLAEAGDTAQVISIEQELAKREAEIESIEGRLRVLDDQASLATITVRFTEADETPPKVDEDLPGPIQALQAGWVALLTVLKVLLAVVLFALPFLPFVALGWYVVRRIRRRRPKPEPRPLGGWTPPGPVGAPPTGPSGPAAPGRPGSPSAPPGPTAPAPVAPRPAPPTPPAEG